MDNCVKTSFRSSLNHLAKFCNPFNVYLNNFHIHESSKFDHLSSKNPINLGLETLKYKALQVYQISLSKQTHN